MSCFLAAVGNTLHRRDYYEFSTENGVGRIKSAQSPRAGEKSKVFNHFAFISNLSVLYVTVLKANN